MSTYDPYDPPSRGHTRRYYHEERRESREPRYVDTQETYLRVNPSSRTDLVPRAREDSDLSIEEVRRDFPPPGYSGSRDVRRARSAEPGYYDDYYDPRYDGRSTRGGGHRGSKKAGSVYYEEEERTRKRVLNKQEKIIAAVVGGVLAAGAKEVWDRREAQEEDRDVDRNLVASAALGAAGALAGYQGADVYNKYAEKDQKKSTYVVHKGRDGRVHEYYSDDEEDVKSRKGNKSFLENALSAAGLGSAIKALTGGGGSDKDKHDDRRSEGRSRRGSMDSHKSRNDAAGRMQKAAKASLVAGAAEAFRVAREPGGWKGEKMKRVVTAAAGAATIDAAHNPDKDSKRHLIESVIGGLVGNRVLNGSRKDIEEDKKTGRSRSRSRARSEGGSGGNGLAALATAGLGALGAKKLLDKGGDDSRESRSRGRRGSADSFDSRYDSRAGSRDRRRSRSRSVVDGARRSLAKLGIGSAPAEERERDDYDDTRSQKSRRRRSPDGYDDDYTSRGYMRGGRGPEDYYDDDRSTARRRSRSRSHTRGGRSGSVSSSDLGDSDDDEKTAKKMRGKQMITTGLATVATIHAAHNVYSSMEKRNARHKAVKEGRLTPMEAKKLKSKAIMQDAASVGIAAMGIKGAISEMKEAREQSHQVREWNQEKQRRHERRMERLKRANDDHHGRSREDDWHSPASPRESRYDDDYGPRYSDGNPYAATLPAPPVGYDRRY
ncbi:hypothetical protein PGQ11_003846 [Apiospora arundinis]|uniref:DUF3824 domain-containing protein n=1 Tax=Apiospora arundinis TaxID=335852 RepID=A0ABR2J6Q8_9PEZI